MTDTAVVDVTTSTSMPIPLPLPLAINFRIPRTDHAVVNSVNANPPTMTERTLRTFGEQNYSQTEFSAHGVKDGPKLGEGKKESIEEWTKFNSRNGPRGTYTYLAGIP